MPGQARRSTAVSFMPSEMMKPVYMPVINGGGGTAQSFEKEVRDRIAAIERSVEETTMTMPTGERDDERERQFRLKERLRQLSESFESYVSAVNTQQTCDRSRERLHMEDLDVKGPSESLTKRLERRPAIVLNRSFSSFYTPDVDKFLPDELRESIKLQSFNAAYLANTYGGVELPKRLRRASEGARRRKKLGGSFTKIAKEIVMTNIITRGMSNTSSISKMGNYCPPEFTELGLKERRRLASLLQWDSLKRWREFNVFEVEDLSVSPVWMGGRGSNLSVRKNTTRRRHSMSVSMTHANFEEDDESDEDDNNNNGKGRFENRGSPIVLIAWAILASPYAQLSMARNVKDDDLEAKARKAMVSGRSSETKLDKKSNSQSDDDNGYRGGYFFLDEFGINPKHLCSFFQRVEKGYQSSKQNPYHSNVHAADVMQSTHAIIQMGGKDLKTAYPPLERYAILLAAAMHDIGHPGTNNNYQINKRTELSLRYNDIAVLENMHASRASYVLGWGKADNNDGDGDDDGNGALGRMSDEQIKLVRSNVIRSILFTDMSRHFSECAKYKNHMENLEKETNAKEATKMAVAQDPGAGDKTGAVGIVNNGGPTTTQEALFLQINREKHVKIREKLLPYILHLSDIANPTKTIDVSRTWADLAYAEFFAQGDREANEGLPVSPLCDRKTTGRADGQIGFIKFVVRPAFQQLARLIPKVGTVILGQLESNLTFWEGEEKKEKEKEKEKEESAEGGGDSSGGE